ncbi:hypothetical protein [Streptomyces sp. NWU339]|uniref:hypothetical protein n=1 Tax=Streptomyces sp. NWU339 TaxID=2185284 RepID=UPI0011B60A53|nr:hypothetical protein [Streptomyces sp. NWU339]
MDDAGVFLGLDEKRRHERRADRACRPLDRALKLRKQGTTPAQEKARRAREEQDRLAARAARDRIRA